MSASDQMIPFWLRSCIILRLQLATSAYISHLNDKQIDSGVLERRRDSREGPPNVLSPGARNRHTLV
jgi:hypothetical protein